MFELDYFNIGFRADSIAQSLKTLENDGYKNFLSDAYKLTKTCQRAWKGEYGRCTSESEQLKTCREILLGDLKNLAIGPQPQGAEIFYGRKTILNETQKTIENLMQSENITKESQELAVMFFDNLSNKCLQLAPSTQTHL